MSRGAPGKTARKRRGRWLDGNAKKANGAAPATSGAPTTKRRAKTRASGGCDLKNFLEYAERGTSAIAGGAYSQSTRGREISVSVFPAFLVYSLGVFGVTAVGHAGRGHGVLETLGQPLDEFPEAPHLALFEVIRV